jgi:hypothetical protein
MTTSEFNNKRVAEWTAKFNADESRVFLIVGMKQDDSYSILGDPAISPQRMADKLEELASLLRKK